MNERIKLLAEQARQYAFAKVELTQDPTEWSSKYYNEMFDQKFGELIVRECLNEIESQRSNGENDDQWTITRDLCYHNMMAQLKQHFGVEE
jgi:hypothetical protein